MKRLLLALTFAATTCSVMAVEPMSKSDLAELQAFFKPYKDDAGYYNLTYTPRLAKMVERNLTKVDARFKENKQELAAVEDKLATCRKESKAIFSRTYTGAQCEQFRQDYYVIDDESDVLGQSRRIMYRFRKIVNQGIEVNKARAAAEAKRIADAKAEEARKAKAEQERAQKRAKREAEQARLRVEAQKRHDARVAEINAKKATMTEAQIKARETELHQQYQQACFDSGNQYRVAAKRLNREYKRLVNNTTYDYVGQGYDRADAREMAAEAFSSLYQDIQRNYKMAGQQVTYCHKQKLFWNF